MFSPYYRRALQGTRGQADPEEHCAINVCLYGPGVLGKHWTMTERARRHVARGPRTFRVGPSALRWDGRSLCIDINERTCPLPRRVQGRVIVQPQALSRFSAALDSAGRHRWAPIAPCARIEVALDAPAQRWKGTAYVDSNEGDEPIDRGFARWDWLRTAPAGDGSIAVIYDLRQREGAPRLIARHFAPDGQCTPFDPGAAQRLPPSRLWRIGREVRAAGPVQLRRTLEDTPFYARTLIGLPLPDGSLVDAVHETLDARRLRFALVQRMLPFRMPRVG